MYIMLNTNEQESDENKVPENSESEKMDFVDDLFEDIFAFINPDKAVKIYGLIRDKIDQFDEKITYLIEEYNQQSTRSDTYLQIVSECQKQTAVFANNQFEKHALHPAIETIDTLTHLIQQIYEQTTKFSEPQTQCPLFSTIISSITQASQIAKEKSQCLDIESIEPEELDDCDPDRHEIRKAVKTNDKSKHKKIKETLVSGLIYRSTVLRQAKVSVYRFSEN